MKILVLTLSNIGDAVLTTAVLEGLKKKFPAAKIDLLLGERVKSIFSSDPRVNQIIVYNKKDNLRHKIVLFRRLREKRYSFVVDLRNTFGSFFIARRVLRNSNIRTHKYLKHNSSLRRFFSPQELKDLKPRVYWGKEEEDYIDSLRLGDFILISPSARSFTKSWPQSHFRELIQQLRKNLAQIELVLVGDKSDFDYCQELVLDQKIRNLAGQTSITQLACLIARARFVITNDSAILHIASATQVSTIALFGPTSEEQYGPLAPNSVVLRKYYPCSPCGKAECKFKDKRCLVNIKPEIVFQTAWKLWKGEKVNIRKDYKRILLSRVDRIGDLVLTTPVIEVLRNNFPNSFISFLCAEGKEAIIENNPYLDEVITLDKRGRHKGIRGFLKAVYQIRKRRFDLALNFHPTNRVHLLCFFSRITSRIGYDWKMGWLNNVIIEHRKQWGEKSEAEYNFDLLRPLGIKTVSFRQTLVPDSKVVQRVRQDLKKEGISEFVLIHPGASSKSKIWPLENFISLARKIIQDYEFKVIFVLGPQETYMAEGIKRELKSSAMIYINLDLRNLIGLISEAKVMISNDSGPLHIADAFSKPLIVIFGRNQPGLSSKRWGPLGKNAVLIQKDVGCRECLADNCQKDFLCLKVIKPDEVYAKFKGLVEPLKKI